MGALRVATRTWPQEAHSHSPQQQHAPAAMASDYEQLVGGAGISQADGVLFGAVLEVMLWRSGQVEVLQSFRPQVRLLLYYYTHTAGQCSAVQEALCCVVG